MARYFVELNYKGTDFHGWQVQPNAVTVQETLEKAFSLILREDVKIIGCGRTDTGVHAQQFFAHYDSENLSIPLEKLCYKLNSLLPKSIAIQRIFEVQNKTHARFDATSRTYKYYISKVKTPFDYEKSYFYPFALDLQKMNEASQLLMKYEDFTSFSKLHTDVKTNICQIRDAHWKENDELLIFTITADRFLRNMVRAIVGTLLEVGKNKCTVRDFQDIILAKDRARAGSSAPPEGLFLHKIAYPFIN
ncbi:tRNA pseudouridine(38-40) synthase [Balneicella halophila]|uniref:tRNA pseudouridine synthase A n=1 Tax=Balneicella halophila TaxID=1537566 RepID=A0A7L4URN8_BALHA|nr:tRNA pseudouridine(38-40) synthase TruA [Balneicella halophila]PVX50989.1 tRNA pseudouridine(38-40) synthase [Balneicella halophila]